MNEENVSALGRTNEDTRLRILIREHARSQGGYDARLFDLWDEWNAEFFEGRMVPSLIQLTTPGQNRNYGDCSEYSGLAGIRSRIRLRPSILKGKLQNLKRGSKNEEGLWRFLADVLLHEMVHQFCQEVTGQTDDGYDGHGPAFSAKVNEIGAKLGLPPVGKTRLKRDCADKGLKSPKHWPHCVRPAEYYLGAHVLSRADKPETVAVPTNIAKAVAVLSKHFDVEELCTAMLSTRS